MEHLYQYMVKKATEAGFKSSESSWTHDDWVKEKIEKSAKNGLLFMHRYRITSSEINDTKLRQLWINLTKSLDEIADFFDIEVKPFYD